MITNPKLNSVLKKPCFCGKKATYERCCYRFISKQQLADTAENLMRARYSAFVQNDLQYIVDTMQGPALADFQLNPPDFNALPKQKWLGLKILSCTTIDATSATVEFFAAYKNKQPHSPIQQLHECSIFKLLDGVWYYYDAQTLTHQHGDGCGCEH